jgi:hypothetical protein
MKRRGLNDPLLVTSDGAPGIIKAIEACFPRASRQHCLAHRLRNLAVKVPEDVWAWVQGPRAGGLSGAESSDRARPCDRPCRGRRAWPKPKYPPALRLDRVPNRRMSILVITKGENPVFPLHRNLFKRHVGSHPEQVLPQRSDYRA